jgi:hypothetical protein
MIQLGLMPQLKLDGFCPMLCNTWGGLADDIHPEQFVASKVSLPDGINHRSEDGLLQQLDNHYQDGAVLVLDQFEELIRDQPAQFKRMTDWIVDITRRHQTKVVISLRAEYEHPLAAMAKNIRPFKMTRFVLRPITALEDIREVMQRANLKGTTIITPEAVDAVAALWQERDSSQVGLLHLQALLYVLSADAAKTSINVKHVEHLLRSSRGHHAATPDAEERRDLGPFEFSLIRAVRLKLDRCIAACRGDVRSGALDEALIRGTEALIRRMISQLSSGGYKLVREQWDLARAVLDREISQLQLPSTNLLLGQMARALPVDDLLAPRTGVIEGRVDGSELYDVVAADPGRLLGQLGVSPVPWQEDPNDTTSGPMAGMSPRAVLLEELRRFLFAVHWLVTASLVRVTPWSQNRTLVSLIHDGFAAGLRSWISDERVRPAEAAARLTASRGETFDWQDTAVDPENTLNGGAGHRYLVNVRWVSCRIFASMRRLVFVNCDFRGSTFSHCDFEGVTFVNCLLDGVTFDQCSINGRVGEPSPREAGAAGLPSFLVKVPSGVVAMLNYYRGGSVEGDILLSRTSGVGAVPWSDPVPNCVPWTPQTGGLAMVGGRLASLAVRRSTFRNGEIAFWYVAGTSLELAEQTSGTLKIFQAAIRGLSVTPPVGANNHGDVTSILARDAKLFNTWLGRGLHGTASLTDCVVIQLVNASDHVEVRLDNCVHAGLVNVQILTAGVPLGGVGVHDLGGIEKLLDESREQMDYRSTPARLELLRMLSAELAREQFEERHADRQP